MPRRSPRPGSSPTASRTPASSIDRLNSELQQPRCIAAHHLLALRRRRADLIHHLQRGAAYFPGSTAMALISIRYSGDVILLTSTIVEAGKGGLKYSARTLWMASKCSMLRT